MGRYEDLFCSLRSKSEIAFVPFVTLGDQGLEGSASIIRTLIDSGADALELGIPFSDPLADGPVIEAANKRALKQYIDTDDCFTILKGIRDYQPKIPIGLLTYANLVYAYGKDRFYHKCNEVGVDSVLVADVPIREKEIFTESAKKYQIASVFIAAPNTRKEELQEIADSTSGYVYMVSRPGVTGAENAAVMPDQELLIRLKSFKAPPCLLGFGISNREDVISAKNHGLDGVISGSAVVKIIEANLNNNEKMHQDLGGFISEMKHATK